MHDNTSRTGIVVSDLHLFSRRSDGERLFDGIGSQLGSADALVLNGDTFDFRWSQMASEAASIDAAIRWLEKLTTSHPCLKVHFLLGNHDCLTVFQRELDQLARSTARFTSHEFRLELGENLFLHGDCANRSMDQPDLENYRRNWIEDRQRGPLAAAAYDAVDALGFSRRVHELWFPQHRTVRRIAHHLDRVMPEWHRRIRRCFFGHTHMPFRDYAWRGVQFSNTGSAIQGMGFQPLEFHWSPHHTTHHERKSHLLL